MKKLRSAKAAILSALSAFFVLGASSAKATDFQSPTLKYGDRLVFAGDSITWLGVNATDTMGWINQFEQRVAAQVPGVTVFASGIPGDSSTSLLYRFKATVLNVQPTVVVIWIGINDIQGFMPFATSQANWYQMLNQALLTPSVREVVLVSPECKGEKRDGQNLLDPQIDAYTSYLYYMAKAGYNKKIFYCPMRAQWAYAESLLNPGNAGSGILTTSPQGLHPNAQGHVFLKNVFCSEFGLKP